MSSSSPIYFRRMRLHARALVLVLVMVWQTLAWMSPYVVGARSELLRHAAVHEQDVDHHHHADASLHLTVDGERSFHFHADEGAQPVGLAAFATSAEVLPPTPTLAAEEALEPPSVFLDGLLRPPCAFA